MKEKNADTPDFLSKKDYRFRDVHDTVESTYVSLRKQGIGSEVKHTPKIILEEENLLASLGLIHLQSLNILSFFMLEKYLAFGEGTNNET